MKNFNKILVAMLAIATIVTVFSFSAKADEVYTVKGVWYLNETLSLSSVSSGISFTSGSNTYTRITISSSIVEYRNGNSVQNVYYSGNWYDSKWRTIDFGTEPQVVSESFYNWLFANGTPPMCDGSTCPANDLNFDSVCDECGQLLVYNLRGLPAIDSFWNKTLYPYGLVYVNNNGVSVLYFFDNPIVSTDGDDIRFNGGNFEVYNLVEGVWTFERTGFGAVDFPSLSSGRILKLSHTLEFEGDILMQGDSSFFPIPLWEEIQGVTQGEMTQTTVQVLGTMNILILCGVGLMGSLVVLSLFGRPLKLFLPK